MTSSDIQILRTLSLGFQGKVEISEGVKLLAGTLRGHFPNIPSENMWEAWIGWASSRNPGPGLLLLAETGWAEEFPEIFPVLGEERLLKRAKEVTSLAANSTAEVVIAALLSLVESEDSIPKFLRRIGAPFESTNKVLHLIRGLSLPAYVNAEYIRKDAAKLFPATPREKYDLLVALGAGSPDIRDKYLNLSSVSGTAESRMVTFETLSRLAKEGKIPSGMYLYGSHIEPALEALYDAQLSGVFRNERDGIIAAEAMFRPSYTEELKSLLDNPKEVARIANEAGTAGEDFWPYFNKKFLTNLSKDVII